MSKLMINELRSTIGGDYGARLYTVLDVEKNNTEIVVEFKLSKRLPIQDIEEAEATYNLLIGDGFILSLDQLSEIKRHGSYEIHQKQHSKFYSTNHKVKLATPEEGTK